MDLTEQIIAFFKDRTSTSSAFLRGLPELQEVSELGKGLANINYLLNFGISRFVMRFNVWPDKVWYNGNEIDIENEYQVLKFLESYKVAPRVYFFDTSKSFFPFSFLIEEFLEHENKAVDTDFEGIAKTIKTLHSIDISEGMEFLRRDVGVEEKIKLYDEWLTIVSKDNEKSIASLFSKYADVYRKYLRDNAELLTGETLIHRDLFPENILFREGGWFLIDWQTAVIGNPIQDIAYLLWDFIYQYTLKRPLSEEEKKTIITAYYGETADVQGVLSDVNKLLPVFYVDLFIWLLYKAESLKEQKLPAELKEFLSGRITGANDIILKEDQIEFWFSKMKND